MTARELERFTEFALSRWPGILRLAHGLTADPGLAEDVARATLTNVYATWAQVRRADDPDAHVRRVLVRTAASRVRGRRAADHVPAGPARPRPAPEGPGQDAPAEHAAARDAPPERDAARDAPPEHATAQDAPTERDAAQDGPPLLPALGELTPRQRAVLVLRYWEELSDGQVAAAVRCSRATVRAEASLALTALRRAVAIEDTPRPEDNEDPGGRGGDAGPETSPGRRRPPKWGRAAGSQGEPPGEAAERELRQGLHGELDGVPVPPAPVDTVTARGRALRTRRRLKAVSGVAALAAIGSGLALASPGTPRPAHAGTAITINAPDTKAPGGVFASGTAHGKAWRLAVRNVADPGSRCLAAVMVNGHDGDLLPPRSRNRPDTVIRGVAFLPDDPAQQAAGFAFVEVRPGVNRVVAHLVNGHALPVRPVTVARCGRSYRLAGFAYPVQGLRRITAYPAAGPPATFVPPRGTFSRGILPPGLFFPGLWSNSWPSGDVTASGRAGAGRAGNQEWTVTVSLGSDGQCYKGAIGPARVTRPATAGRSMGPGGPKADRSAITVTGERSRSRSSASIGGALRSSVECQPVEAPPAAGVSWTPIYSLTTQQTTGYAGSASPSATAVVVDMADGARLRITPAIIGGRKYFALVIPRGSRVVRVVSYDAAGHELHSTASFPQHG